jgi:hypothetical protein
VHSHEDIARITTCVGGPDRFQAYGPSIDHVIGNFIDQRPLVVAAEPYRDQPNWQTNLSWRAAGAAEPYTTDHRQVFADSFAGAIPSGATEPAPVEVVDNLHAQNQSVLDFMLDDLSSFKTRLSAEDQAKLDLHIESVREVERRVAGATNGTPSVSSTAICEPDSMETAVQQNMPSQQTDLLRSAGELHIDLIASAFACGTRRVATLQWQEASDGHNPAEGGGSHHNVTHTEAPNWEQQWETIDRFYVDRFKYAIEALEARGVLDDTILVWVSEISEQHNQNNFNNIIAGGRNLGIVTGQYVLYPFAGGEENLGAPVGQDTRNRSFADLWVTFQQAFGMGSESFGDPQWSFGALPEIRRPT